MKLIGLAELAELYGVSKNTANTWARRHDWPAPVANLKMGPVWDQDLVLAHKPLEINYRRAIEINCAHCGNAVHMPVSVGADFTVECMGRNCGKTSKVSIYSGDLDLGVFVHITREDA